VNLLSRPYELLYAKTKKLATKEFVTQQREIAHLPVPFRDRLHVVTLTPFYPCAGDDAFGCFVAEPLPYLAPHGIETSTFAVRPFYRSHFHVHVAAPPATWCSFASFPGPLGLASAGRFLFLRLLADLRDLHRRSRIDLIHAHSALPCGRAAMLLARALNIPFVVSVHGVDAFSTRQVEGRAGNRCRLVSDEIYRAAQCVICVSEHVRKQVLTGVSGPVNTAVIYNGADEVLFSPSPTPAEGLTVVSVGDVIPSKGQELVLRAVASLREQFPELSYEIIGDGPSLLSLKQLAIQLNMKGRVRFLGRCSRTEVAQALRRCAVFALPSTYEGLGCAYLEAMATAKPAIGCRGQGIEEIIRHGVNGFLVDGTNMAEMAGVLRQLLADCTLRENIGRAARHTLLDRFTLAHQAEHLNQVYRNCLR